MNSFINEIIAMSPSTEFNLFRAKLHTFCAKQTQLPKRGRLLRLKINPLHSSFVIVKLRIDSLKITIRINYSFENHL